MELNRTSRQLYRDCLRLAQYIAPKTTRKYDAIRSLISGQFRANAAESEPERIQELKNNAIRALANYLTYDGLAKSNPEAVAAQTGGFHQDKPSSLPA